MQHDEQVAKNVYIDDIAGRLRKYANSDLMPLEEGAWERAAAQNYMDYSVSKGVKSLPNA